MYSFHKSPTSLNRGQIGDYFSDSCHLYHWKAALPSGLVSRRGDRAGVGVRGQVIVLRGNATDPVPLTGWELCCRSPPGVQEVIGTDAGRLRMPSVGRLSDHCSRPQTTAVSGRWLPVSWSSGVWSGAVWSSGGPRWPGPVRWCSGLPDMEWSFPLMAGRRSIPGLSLRTSKTTLVF